MQAAFGKPEDKERRHLRPLYIKGYVDSWPMTKMLVDGGAAINVMPYAAYRKLEKGEEDFIKTDMMLKNFEGKASPTRGTINVELTIGSKTPPLLSSSLMARVHTIYSWDGIGSTPIIVFHPPCINASSNGWKMLLKWYTQIRRLALQQSILKSKDMMEWSASRVKFGKEIS
jgi:hypothetical protein